ncbi:hypothetical protein M6D93_07370 [Jatrophihabitans telluris]|uniref:Integral membrane protein n=1 Tax=Jatrophihabitans telluris TaxID=2038343 RepID=A0ABY4R4I4_9ACTN|nr:hypothetical protein [Jatrophihabitans telluris]UQX89814.1 hypothetical protein M6D93_07370 [Jatrophihabitans telluris]
MSVTDPPHGVQRPGSGVPEALRWAVLVAMVEAVALVAGAALYLVLIFTRTSTQLWAAFTVLAFMLFGAAVLYFGARGIAKLSPSARTPVLLLNLLSLPVSFDLGFQAGRLGIALPMLLAAVVEIGLLMSPSGRRALDREL